MTSTDLFDLESPIIELWTSVLALRTLSNAMDDKEEGDLQMMLIFVADHLEGIHKGLREKLDALCKAERNRPKLAS